MKKIFSLIAIAAVATTMFTSCKDSGGDKPGPQPTDKAKLTLEVDKTTVAVDGTGTFTIKSDIAAPEAITMQVTSTLAQSLSVTPTNVTIAKGEKTVQGTFKGLTEGKSKIMIIPTSDNATIEKGEIEITVTGKEEEEEVEEPIAPTGAKVEKLTIAPATWNGFLASSAAGIFLFNIYEVTYKPDPGSIGMDLGKGNVKGLGSLDDDGFLLLASQKRGTSINLADMKSPGTDRPRIWTADYTALATGKNVYIAVACGDYDNTSDDHRAWLKVKISTAGGWSSISVIEGYRCLDDKEFKVGQTE